MYFCLPILAMTERSSIPELGIDSSLLSCVFQLAWSLQILVKFRINWKRGKQTLN